MPAGMSSAQVRSAAVLYEPLRRLPLIPSTCRSAITIPVLAKAASLLDLPSDLVAVAVMQVRVVRMAVTERGVPVSMAVRLTPIPGEVVLVPVMLVVYV